MAMLCSVTVSIGDERRGVLREMRLVTGESRVTSLAEKPGFTSKLAEQCARAHSAAHTNVTGEDEEVVVGQTAVGLGVKERLDVDAIALGVLILDKVKSVLVVKDLLLGEDGNLSGHFVAVGDVRIIRGKGNKDGKEKRQMTQMGISIESGTTKRSTGSSVNTFPKKRREKRERFEIFLQTLEVRVPQGSALNLCAVFAVFDLSALNEAFVYRRSLPLLL